MLCADCGLYGKGGVVKVEKRTYRDYWGYYWRVTSRHAISGIFDWDRDLVELVVTKCNPPARAEIIDLGCAGGDQAKQFAQKGYHVTGIDQVPALIQHAKDAFRKENLEGDFEVADFREITYESRYDLCVMFSGTFGFHMPGEDMNILQKIYRALKAGGKAFIDYLPVETYSKRQHTKTWHEIEGGFALAEEWYHVPTSTWRTKHWHIFLDGRLIEAADESGYGANEVLRCYSALEIEHLVENVGFKVLAHLGRQHVGNPDYDMKDDDPRGIVVLEKVK